MSDEEKVSIPIDEDRNAMHDAFDDMQDEHEAEGEVPAYFGSGVVCDVRTMNAALVNFLIRDAVSYEEAVGIAYLQLADNYPGYVVAQINIDEEIVWAKPEPDEDDDDTDDDEVEGDSEVPPEGTAA